jgi:tellurite resistance protein
MSCATPAATQAPRLAPSLEHLGLIWFVPVMGLSGLSLAWGQAEGLFGSSGLLAAHLIGALAALLFAVLLLLSLWRLGRWPRSLHLEWMHPVRHVFLATVPVSLILLATVGTTLTGVASHWDALWQVGAVAQGLLTLAVLWRWQRMRAARWPGVTPGLLIPVVGNVLVPLAGLRLGHPDWSLLQAGMGILLWPVVLVMLVLRVRRIGVWPDRLRPSVFILVAPPSVIGLDLMLWQVGPGPVVLCWVLGLGFLAWAMAQLPRCFDQPFGMPMWSMSFPLAAFASFTLRLGHAGWLPAWVGLIALALASVKIAALLRWTWWGLRSGDLLQPDPAPVPKP